MNSVDTGWVTDEDPPLHRRAQAGATTFTRRSTSSTARRASSTPFFIRPQYRRHVWGQFLKDYGPRAARVASLGSVALKLCPCHSGQPYKACCKPLHEGTRIAETPEALMRSRYAAFALGLGAYLVDTLASDHEDRAAPRERLVRELARVKDRQRFLGLRVHASSADGDEGEVVFSARIFERGVDRSFTERSRFVREDGAWRYASGTMEPPQD
jgi:SEC-C motif domain protein